MILIRHGDRHWKGDQGLTEKGQRQAQAIAEFLHQWGALEFRASPKTRCIETLEPAARMAHLSLHVDSLLDEKDRGESEANLLQRLSQFMDQWQWSDQYADHLAICSHGDWLPLAVDRATGMHLDFPKGGVAELHALDDGQIVVVGTHWDLLSRKSP